MPAAVADLGVGALLGEQRRDVVVGVDDGDHHRAGAVRIGAVRSAPASLSARAASSEPCRAAYISAVKPPRGSAVDDHRRGIDLDLGELQHVRGRVDVGAALDQQLDDGRVVVRRPPTSARPRRSPPSRALTSAPRSSSSFTASGLPVRAAVISTVSPAGHGGVRIRPGLEQRGHHLGAAVGRRQRERRQAVAVRRVHVGAGPDQQLHHLDVVARAAQCSAVVPSASRAFTSTRCCTSTRAISRFPLLTASIRRTSGAGGAENGAARRRRPGTAPATRASRAMR